MPDTADCSCEKLSCTSPILSSVDAVFVVVVVVVATFDVLLMVEPFDAAFEPLSAVAPELFEPSVDESD